MDVICFQALQLRFPSMTPLKINRHARRLTHYLRSSTLASGSSRTTPSAASTPPLSFGLRNVSSAATVGAQTPTTNDIVDAAYPTLPPRPKGITDGKWDKADEAAVQQALDDAEKIARQALKYGAGEVILAQTLGQ